MKVLAAYNEFHAQRICYRDLKPGKESNCYPWSVLATLDANNILSHTENLVLDSNGYCVMIDFGLAKRCDG